MRNVIQLFLAANTILLMRKWNHACSLLVYVSNLCHYSRKAARANRFPKIVFIKKQTQWSNDKIIIELGYCKISWFVSVSPSASANNWSAHHRQITIFCSTSSNNIIAKYLYWRYPEHSNIKQTIRYKSCDVVSKKIKVEANYTEKKKHTQVIFLSLGYDIFLAAHNFDDLFSQFRIILLCLSLPFSKKSHLVITQIDFLAEHVTF